MSLWKGPVREDTSHGHGHGHGHSEPSEPSAAGGHGHGVPSSAGFVASQRHSALPREELAPGAGIGKTLYFDMPSGIAGDMTLAAFLDLGVPLQPIKDAIAALGLDGVRLEVRSGYVGAIGCSHLSVEWDHQAAERSFLQIKDMIQGAPLDEATQSLALAIFQRLAEAEAEVHRTTLDKVHFHEVGAVDAIVDIVGTARAVSYLGATVKASSVPLGRGFVTCRHGVLPLPAPAALLCLRNVPTEPSGLDVELVTPTGAAIIATLAQQFVSWCSLTPERVGWGAGTRGLPDRPNALRLVLGQEALGLERKTMVELQANIDDMTGELASFALRKVMASGAVDVWMVPSTMKKGRPGIVFSALAKVDAAERVARAILEETSTIGVRQHLVERRELPRESFGLATPWGPVRVKRSQLADGSSRWKAEFSDLARISQQTAVPLREVVSQVEKQLTEMKGEPATPLGGTD